MRHFLYLIGAENVVKLRKGYLERITQNWLPYETQKLTDLKAKLANGDMSVKKEVERISGYIEFLKNEVNHSIARSKMHGVNFDKFKVKE